jgi:hypothetical protein
MVTQIFDVKPRAASEAILGTIGGIILAIIAMFALGDCGG